MKTAVIILHYGDIETTRKCIESLQKHETSPYSCIVVNNMPTVYKVKDFSSKQLTVINNKKNLGFAAGVNVGIRHALQKGFDAICLLNNDTTIKQPIIKPLSEELSTSSVGIVGPAIQFKKNKKTLYDIGGKVSFFGRTSHTEVQQINNVKTHPVTYISGCCMMIKKSVFKKIGFFDEHFFLYYEDADFCLRAKKAGFDILVLPSIIIRHELSHSAGKMSSLAIYYLTKSSIYFGEKYYGTSWKIFGNRLFIFLQSILFVKVNPMSALVVAKGMLQ